ncbi:hypothetical protein [Pseudomonas amygdali]|uniref:Uncharacterized protein n=2 Tax=Pseudomonas amygdali pv. lachrymans TaxID=53707 RepID=A0AAD0PVC1_PSEAV|nr:hypothetical protein [Pseudomonas amygdali]AXH59426.1 hypothetical protein PLA107_029820 [Pseudomonas amygdali pv. lachrymans str. M301315]RMT06533.1 hypothetical protein ALP54_03359 [Pseudomonas amygdali pv. lachrymans]
MYHFKIDPPALQPIMNAIEQYSALMAGQPNFFLIPGVESATQELNQLWNEMRPAESDKPALGINFDEPLTRQQLLTVIRAFEVSVFLGDGRYCSLLDHVEPLLQRHPNAYLLRQAFVQAEQNFAEMRIEKRVDPKFRELAVISRELMASLRICGQDIKEWVGPGMTIIKKTQLDEDAELNP